MIRLESRCIPSFIVITCRVITQVALRHVSSLLHRDACHHKTLSKYNHVTYDNITYHKTLVAHGTFLYRIFPRRALDSTTLSGSGTWGMNKSWHDYTPCCGIFTGFSHVLSQCQMGPYLNGAGAIVSCSGCNACKQVAITKTEQSVRTIILEGVCDAALTPS